MTTTAASNRLLVVMALPVEEQGVLRASGIDVLFTGVGKINAATAVTRRLTEMRLAGAIPRLIVNFGTAGSRRFDAGAMVACHRFVQRDMDVSPLGFARGHTPYDDHASELEFPPLFAHLPAAICGTGDSFQTGPDTLPCDVVDMEAYAMAKVCRLEGLPFACAKYITDGADHGAASDWLENLPRAAAGFLALYRDLSAL